MVALQVVAIHQQSLSGDGAYHLLAGDQALRYGQNEINLEHPPLAKLVMALPQLTEDRPLAPRITVDQALVTVDRIHEQPQRLWRAAVAGRYLVLLVFALPFLAACYALGSVYADRRTGLVLLFLIGLSLSVVPYLTILQTDAAVAAGFLLVLLAVPRFAARGGLGRAALVGLALGLAVAAKHSGLLIAPAAVLAVALAWRRGQRWWRAPAQLLVIALLAAAVVELTYAAANLRYDSERGRQAIRLYCQNRGTLIVGDRLRAAEPLLLAVERREPRLAQWLTGLLGIRVQNAIGVYPSYAFGDVRPEGRWWYFPAVLALKTPLPILVAALAFAAGGLRRRRRWRRTLADLYPYLPLIVTGVVYLGTAIGSTYNLGVRHLLPILPLLYLPVARGLARRPRAAALVVALLALESLALTPLWMSATNTWWLGNRNPTRFALSASDLEYKQNFIQLARYARAHGIDDLKVIYPALGEAVVRAYLPDASLVRPDRPLAPGWYAVTVRVEQYLPVLARKKINPNVDRLAAAWQEPWRRLLAAAEDHGYVAGTFHLYYLPEAAP